MTANAHLRRVLLASALLVFLSGPALASTTQVRTVLSADGRTVIDLLPKTGPGCHEVLDPGSKAATATQPPPAPGRFESTGSAGFPWEVALENNAVFTDLSMADSMHGFASAELGRVFRTTDGASWHEVLNLGFPHYWYGVHALSPGTVFISGFQNQSGEGIGRWSYDGGTTWTPDLVIDPTNWLTICQFADRDHGIATRISGGMTYRTTNGGATPGDWTQVLADPTGGWFAGNFTFMPENRYVYITGISFCRSLDGGANYVRRPSIDPVFDGGVSFPDTVHGWTGGGQISTPVQGWVHRTTDAGQSWSGRILNPPYPIRSLLFFDESLGFAVGGNYFQGIGGIWSTSDGGLSWNLDVDTGCEMKGIDWARVSPDSVDVWCAGSRNGLGRIYRTRVYLPSGSTGLAADHSPPSPTRLRASPNPTRHGQASITVATGIAGPLVLDIVNVTGRRVRRLDLGRRDAGEHTVSWDGRTDRGGLAAPGTYYVLRPQARGVDSIALVLVR